MKCFTLAGLMAAALAIPVAAQDQQPSFVGSWTLKSIAVNSKPAKEVAALRDFGGVEDKMNWRFRKMERNNTGDCPLNDVEAEYEFLAETSELLIHREVKGAEVSQVLIVKMVGKDMKLSFKEKGKKVELLFVKEE